MRLRFLSLLLLFGFAAPLLRAQDGGADAEKVLVGKLTIEQLIDLPGWFGTSFLEYQPLPEYMDQIPRYMDGVNIVCVLGTWCSDSKREVPRFLRIMQLKNIDPQRFVMLGVDRNKISPNGETAAYGIEKVPTFVFFRDGKEIGRIVEAPLGSLEKNVLGIVRGGPDPNEAITPVLQAPPPEAQPPAPPPPSNAPRGIKPVQPPKDQK
jgi:thiol-disulfide isomerase/thioredoxin